MDEAKYVVLKHMVCDFTPIIFPSYVTHADMVAAMGLDYVAVDSAGFVRSTSDGTASCYGKSVGLNKESKPERDEALINRMLGRGDF